MGDNVPCFLIIHKSRQGGIHCIPFSLIEKIWEFFYAHGTETTVAIPVYILDSDEVSAYAMLDRTFVM
jgi:hypothetical protein